MWEGLVNEGIVKALCDATQTVVILSPEQQQRAEVVSRYHFTDTPLTYE